MPPAVEVQSLHHLTARDALLGDSCQALSEGLRALGCSERLGNYSKPCLTLWDCPMASRKTEISLSNLLSKPPLSLQDARGVHGDRKLVFLVAWHCHLSATKL